MDQNFDNLAERFKHKVYKSGKGKVRLTALHHDLEQLLPKEGHPLSILDAGGGQGQTALWLASKGHNIQVCDISAEMLALAQTSAEAAGLNHRLEFHNIAIEKCPNIFKGQKFDLILLHGVIEWMDRPLKAIEDIQSLLDEKGIISLLFFNRDKLIFKWGINSQTDKAMTGRVIRPRPLTPKNPLSTTEVMPILEKHDLEVISKSGIRIFYGFFSSLTRELTDDQLKLELQYMHQEPFASLGEHTHLIAKKKKV